MKKMAKMLMIKMRMTVMKTIMKKIQIRNRSRKEVLLVLLKNKKNRRNNEELMI